MKRYAALILAAVVALLGVTALAPGAQAQQTSYPVISLNLKLSLQTVVSGHTFVATVTASVKCDQLTQTWKGQTVTGAGSTLTHKYAAPVVTKPTVIPIHVVCTYTLASGVAGSAIALQILSQSRTANVLVVPVAHPGKPVLPDTGGPNVGWLIGGGAAVAAGGLAMFFGRRRRDDEITH